MSEVAMFVAAHKPVDWVASGYNLIQVGAANHKHFCDITDDVGDNISKKNPSYCEVTALYWIWKNFHADAVGLVHYRRYFMRNRITASRSGVLSIPEIESLINHYNIIIPDGYTFSGNVRDNYVAIHDIQQLDVLRDFFLRSPEELRAFDQVMQSKTIPLCNMFVMAWPLFDAYMSWLMPILEYCENHIDTSSYNSYNQRMVGFIAERLLSVWLVAEGQMETAISVPASLIDMTVTKSLMTMSKRFLTGKR